MRNKHTRNESWLTLLRPKSLLTHRSQSACAKRSSVRKRTGGILNYQSLEQRQMLATVSLVSGALLISDATMIAEDEITISYTSGLYTITDPGLTITTSISGATGNGTNTVTIPDTNITSITFSTVQGDDIVTVESVQPGLGDLTILGGSGSDLVNLNAEINFAANANLHVDLTNGSRGSDLDQIVIGQLADLIFSGTGSATMIANSNITVEAGQATLEVENGDLVMQSNIGRANYHSPNLALPTIDNGTTISELDVNDAGTIRDLHVTVDLDHTNNADLDVFLIHPDGTRVELFSDVGGSGEDFKNTSFDVEARSSIVGSSAPHTGIFLPAGDLSALEGKSVTGTWTLEVTDDTFGNTGRLNSWSINVLTNVPMPTTGPTSGVALNNANVKTTGSGDILLTGRGGVGNAQLLFGVGLDGAVVESTSSAANAGSIQFDGIGGSGTSFNYGVRVESGRVTAVEGEIVINGEGRGSTSSNWGVDFLNTTIRSNADIAVTGVGGQGTAFNDGVSGSSFSLRSLEGNLVVIGVAGGSSQGIEFSTGASIGGSAELLLQADDIALIGGPTLSSDGTVILKPLTNGYAIDVGTDAVGALGLTDSELDSVFIAGLVQVGDELSGTITVSAPITHSKDLELITGAGVDVNEAISMSGGMDFTITATGTAAGVELLTANADVAVSSSGEINITTARNIFVSPDASITTVNGDLMLSANPNGTGAGSFSGIDVNGGLIQSAGTGQVVAIGRGGTANVDQFKHGVQVRGDGDIIGGASGLLTVQGSGGQSNGIFNYGINVFGTGSTITSSGANISVVGQGGGTSASAGYNHGVAVFTGGQVVASGTSELVINGTSGNSTSSGTFNMGVVVESLGSRIGTQDGDLTVTGNGNGAGTRAAGITANLRGEISSTGAGGLVLTGVGSSSSSGDESHGVWMGLLGPVEISTNTGAISIFATAGAGSTGFAMDDFAHQLMTTDATITIEADSIDIEPGGSIAVGNGQPVTLRQITNGTAIDLGGADVAGTLGLTDAELDRITAGTIIVGDINSGSISVTSPITLSSSAALILSSVDSVNPVASGVDIDTSSTVVAAGADLNIVIDGTAVDTGYDQLGIVGQIDLTGVGLSISGNHSPSEGDQFVIVDNDGTDPIVGTFNGLPEGAMISNFLGSGLEATISYLGTDGLTGNDVVLQVAAEVKGQFVFYNDSSFDDGSNGAIDVTKQALLPGGVATFDNYTSYIRGINGLMVDVAGLASTPTIGAIDDYFEFKVGNNNTPAGWADAAAPIGVTVHLNAGTDGSDRFELAWADNAIRKTWIEVTVLANGSTGLSDPYVFYFGNAPGETGNNPANAIVNLSDVALTRQNQTGFSTADIDNVYDFNRDGRVNLPDVALARENQSGFTPLRLIDLSQGRPAGGGKGNPGFVGISAGGDSSGNSFRATTGQGKDAGPFSGGRIVLNESSWLDAKPDFESRFSSLLNPALGSVSDGLALNASLDSVSNLDSSLNSLVLNDRGSLDKFFQIEFSDPGSVGTTVSVESSAEITANEFDALSDSVLAKR